MNIYKITNISDKVGKRNANYNTTITIDYVNNLRKEKLNIRPGQTTFLQINKLPISAHSLRVKGLVSVTEISAAELKNIMSQNKKPAKKKVEATKKSVQKKPTKKTTTKKTVTSTKKASTTKKSTTKKKDEGYYQ